MAYWNLIQCPSLPPAFGPAERVKVLGRGWGCQELRMKPLRQEGMEKLTLPKGYGERTGPSFFRLDSPQV